MSPLYRGEIYCFTSHRSFVVTSVLCLCVLLDYYAGGQTRDFDPMPGYCWPTVYDAETTLAQYYRVVFDATLNVGQRHRRRANINPALVQSILPVLQPAWNRPTDYGWMDISQHRRRWPNI